MLPFIDKDDYKARERNSKKSKTAVVDPIVGEPLRFHVQSRTVEDLKYLVDLEEYGFNGFCGCQDFDFRKRMIAQKMNGERARCWHIERARDFFIDMVLKKMARNFYESSPRITSTTAPANSKSTSAPLILENDYV